jgi:hypothetical protein
MDALQATEPKLRAEDPEPGEAIGSGTEMRGLLLLFAKAVVGLLVGVVVIGWMRNATEMDSFGPLPIILYAIFAYFVYVVLRWSNS